MRRIVIVGAAALAVAGCGGKDGPGDEALVRQTLQTFATAVEQRDYQTLCDDVFAPKLLQGLEQIGLPCEIAMRTSFQEVRDPKLTVGAVSVTGTHATAQVKTSASGQAPSTDSLELDKLKAGWRVSALGQSGGPTGAASPKPTS